jgi:glucan phosphoethanolaminetransferase (alkaline phosphatase superfamily)
MRPILGIVATILACIPIVFRIAKEINPWDSTIKLMTSPVVVMTFFSLAWLFVILPKIVRPQLFAILMILGIIGSAAITIAVYM